MDDRISGFVLKEASVIQYIGNRKKMIANARPMPISVARVMRTQSVSYMV